MSRGTFSKLHKSSSTSVDSFSQSLLLQSSFLENFLQYYQAIKAHCQSSSNIAAICESLYQEWTLPFYTRWYSVFPFLKLSSQYSTSPFFSFVFDLPSQAILIPHKLVIYETLDQGGRIGSLLSSTTSISELFDCLLQAFRSFNLQLNKNDVRILQGLSSKAFLQSSQRFPPLESLARLCQCSRSTFSRRFDFLKDSLGILQLFYRLDMAKLGYETFVSFLPHENLMEHTPIIQRYCLVSLPLNSFLGELETVDSSSFRRHQLLICQLPYHQIKEYDCLCHKSQPLFFQSLSHSYIGWNLRSLTPSRYSRWTVMPPILSRLKWSDEILSEDNGITYNLRPESYYTPLTPTELKLLSHFEKYSTGLNFELAQQFKVDPKTLKVTWRRLAKHKLLHRFLNLSKVGLSFQPWITLIGQNSSTCRDMVANILEHLKFFPFTYLFYDFGDIELGQPPLLMGLVYLAPNWAAEFCHRLSLLRDHGFLVDLHLSFDRLIKWNINLAETYSRPAS